ncbi:Uma2 family endonuclease [Spongiactinospora sp. TRM90649]|uniref:Uma2 family endonuclease n=1 Tax=Spongiactinospora sp. TRM90649 TaxID=3031114 RepID=UPI0023F816A5|nr:Uma2 family endonuclease [Spongiactinospora sp. TRM90649]MDF5754652.1 Uma2 family endonuclease [Spongiactinospora sp. TRM90649]
MTSRQVHRDTRTADSVEVESESAPQQAPEERPKIDRMPTTVREFVEWLPELPALRVEVVNGRVIVSPRGNPRQSWIIGQLVRTLGPLADERDWLVWPELDVCMAWTREPLVPDFAMGPKDAPTWGDSEIISNGLIMVAEVVSRSSTREDREDKPLIYARGGVPLYLVVDPEAEPQTMSVWSDPTDDGYRTVTRVKMGEELPIPEPVGAVLDTSVFAGA